MRVFSFDLELYQEALRQTVKTEEWRTRLSTAALQGSAEQGGLGIMLVTVGTGSKLLPCREQLATARFVPGRELASVVPDPEEQDLLRQMMQGLNPLEGFILAVVQGPGATMPVPGAFYTFGNGPGVGIIPPGLIYEDQNNSSAPGAVRSQELTPEIQKVMDARTVDEVMAAAATEVKTGRTVPIVEHCCAPGCNHSAITNRAMFPGMQVSPHIVAKLLRCQGCRKVQYCGQQCQMIHWKAGHKKECKLLAARGNTRGNWTSSLLNAAASR